MTETTSTKRSANIIDSHCHLPKDIGKTKEILTRAHENGVTKAIVVGTNLETNKEVTNLANSIDDLYCTIAIYPQHNQETPIDKLIQKLEEQLKLSNKIVAIGECGIDDSKWGNQRPITEQIKLFERQVQLAIKHNLPIAIHNRNGDKQIFEVLNRYKGQIRGVGHCFDGSWETAQKYLNLGFFISFSGFLTYNSKAYLCETAQKAPFDKILIETDAPYIVPKGVKDTKMDSNGTTRLNEPKNVKMIALKLADIRKVSFEEVAKQTYKNTCDLFGITP